MKIMSTVSLVSCPYRDKYEDLPVPISHGLKLMGISCIQPDGEYLVLLSSDPVCWQDVLASIYKQYPQPVEDPVKLEIEDNLNKLLRAVIAGTPSHEYQPIHSQWWAANKRACLRVDESHTTDMSKKWRSWTPKTVSKLEPLSQRKLEVQLKQKWLARLLSHFIPYASAIPYFRAVMGKGDDLREFMDLLGASRFSSLRAHTLNLEKMIQIVPDLIPWNDEKVVFLLNKLRQNEATPSKVQQYWTTLRFLSIKTGLLNPDALDALRQKKEAVRDSLVTTLLLPQKRATVPSLEMVQALETLSRRPGPDGYVAALARFMIGCSGRLSDIQHTQPSTMHLTNSTIEFVAWQTKVMSVTQNRQKPTPLISPLHFFTGIQWWLTLSKAVKWFLSQPHFENMDFMLPCPTKDRLGFVSRPAGNSQAMRWLKSLLATLELGGLDLKKLTWPSFRVFMADWAYQCGISRDRRRYIGRWANEGMADTYTREHRAVICDIWEEVLIKKDLLRPSAEVPENLEDNYYYPEEEQEPDALQAIVKMPADKVPPEKGGPLTPMSIILDPKSKRSCKAHLFRQDGRAVGCGWCPKSGHVKTLIEEDWLQDPHSTERTKCFMHFTWPSTWATSGGQIIITDSSDSEVDTDSEIDSDEESNDESTVAIW